MSDGILKVSCVLHGDNAIDFERLLMEFKASFKSSQYGNARHVQQAALIGTAMLVLDANKRQYAETTGKRYPTLVELLEWLGIPRTDINKALGIPDFPDASTLEPLTEAIAQSIADKVTGSAGANGDSGE